MPGTGPSRVGCLPGAAVLGLDLELELGILLAVLGSLRKSCWSSTWRPANGCLCRESKPRAVMADRTAAAAGWLPKAHGFPPGRS